MSFQRGLLVVLTLAMLAILLPQHAPRTVAQQQDLRAKSEKLMQDGNFKEALAGFRQLCLNPSTDRDQVGSDLDHAVQCLERLGSVIEFDDLVESTIELQLDNPKLLQAAARQYMRIPHYGMIIGNEFQRGGRRGGGKRVNSTERDRVRALQLLELGLPLVRELDDKRFVGQYLREFANLLLSNRGAAEAWRLQYLTDLSTLPDYDEGYAGYRPSNGAPVDDDGNPVFHHPSKTWDAAKTDGERYRWALMEAVENDPSLKDSVLEQRAQFLHQLFGVQTMRQGNVMPMMRGDGPIIDDGKEDESGPYAVRTLDDNETIARLATGIKRFELPDEFNFIKLWGQVDSINALRQLAYVYENRQQLPTAAEKWRAVLKKSPQDDGAERRLSQIVDNWGRFENTMARPAGDKGVELEFRFRNSKSVKLTAQEVDMPKLLADVKQHLKSNPQRVDYQLVRPHAGTIAHDLVNGRKSEYLTGEERAWSQKLDPPADHLDGRVAVETPLKEAGAYWVEATVPGGNKCAILVWLEDTAIVRKQLSNKNLYFVADARTGEPISGATVEFFGYRQQRQNNRRLEVLVENFADRTDQEGMCTPDPRDLKTQYQWLITATKGERMASMGFAGAYTGAYHDQQYNQTKIYGITDRPVYRPGDTVQFKAWLRKAQYDHDTESQFAGQQVQFEIYNAKGDKVLTEQLVADEYGGVVGSLELPADANLGQYRMQVHRQGPVGTFRVEEYKKPEFEVLVEAPTEPVMLGEKVDATVRAKYYFGAPVTEATVKIKVTREEKLDDWYPSAPWDWCYGPGYWWFCYDAPWYPGFQDWVGCRRPMGWWFPAPRNPPELVLELETEIGPEGEVNVEIDTELAKALHGDKDHRYSITAEVRDLSRRTIVGTGEVLVARKPFKVYTWMDRGYYEQNQPMTVYVKGQTPDQQPVQGAGVLKLFSIRYDEDRNPIEEEVGSWKLDTDDQGRARKQLTAARAGQFRLSYQLTDPAGHRVEGGYLFTIMGSDYDGGEDFRFNELELIPDKPQYAPGDTVKLQINTDLKESTVLLFVRPSNGVYLPPRLIRMDGKSQVEEIAVIKKDMPNFFVEAMTVADGKVYQETKEIVVPPEKRVLNVEVMPSADEYLPGEEATVKLRLTDHTGENFVGSTAVAIYDKSVEYISGGSNVPNILEHFWKWRRSHRPQHQSSLNKHSNNVVPDKTFPMATIGAFGDQVAANGMMAKGRAMRSFSGGGRGGGLGGMEMADAAMPMAAMAAEGAAMPGAKMEGVEAQMVAADNQPIVRSNFADTALWVGTLETDSNGMAQVRLNMPESLTTWKVKVWGMGHGTRVGEGEAEVVTRKNIILRMQAPRFFLETDEVVLSANVHNYLKDAKDVSVTLETEGPLKLLDAATSVVKIDADGEHRVDWRVRVTGEGQAVVRMKAITDEESDAMEMKFPAYVHGALRTEAWAGTIRPEQQQAKLVVDVPSARRPEQSVLEVRYSPSLAGAMVDALPYLAEYPHGCTEQTLNRFLPSVITQKVLRELGVNLAEIKEKRTNLNAQEIGDDRERAKQWKRFDINPVFDEAEVDRMVREGIKRLTSMQLADGGWGWFSGYREYSSAHTTAVVVHGLQVAVENDVPLVPGVLEKGVQWLKNYQQRELEKLQNADAKAPKKPRKERADNLDALVYMILTDAGQESEKMRTYLYRDRTELSVYAMAMFGLGLEKVGAEQELAMVVRNIGQYLVTDTENETAYLKLRESSQWWYWHGSEIEANAFYLKLLTRVDPQGKTAPRLVKYLLNNRKHATYWRSTRDTALCVEAFADFIRASGEMKPDMVLQVFVDGKKHKEVAITPDNLFTFDNKLLIEGDDLTDGSHEIEIRRQGKGPVYFNTYLTNFSLEEYIKRAGLEVRVNRKYYRLVEEDKSIKAQGRRGQVADQKVEKYRREELGNLADLKSGELVEVELIIDSKNDYEYLVFEDMKAAGFEPVDVRSGYVGSGLHAYRELRDNRVSFYVRRLPRGQHSLTYKLRAEIPGKFSALPARAEAMYAPELRGNSDEIKFKIVD